LLKIHPVNKFNHWPVNTIWYYVVARWSEFPHYVDKKGIEPYHRYVMWDHMPHAVADRFVLIVLCE
jgi:hypothetical protein